MTATLPVITDVIRFRVNGTEVEADAPGGRRLLDVLRVDLGLTGTKEGCGEGECGVCSVLLDGVLVNACLVPLGQVDGREVLTVEGLATDGRLDPLQQSFLEMGGTQCGFCAPAMLMAARAFLASGHAATEPAIREAIAGNLCRCTGYTKIIEAIETAGDLGAPPEPGAEAWAGAPSRAASAITIADSRAAPRVVRPTSLYEALARLAADPHLRPIAGGTDVMVELAAGIGVPGRPLLDLWDLDELRLIEVEHDELILGALTTYADLRHSPVVHGALPVLAEVAASVGAAQIQNRGTIGGNCMTASPAADMAPVLLATDARFELAGPRRHPDRAGRAVLDRLPENRPGARGAARGRPDPACPRAPRPVPQGGDASGPVDREGVDRGCLAYRAWRAEARGTTFAWPWGPWRPRRSAPRERRRSWKAPRPARRPPPARPRSSATRSRRSTTSARRRPTAARSPAASCAGSSWTPPAERLTTLPQITTSASPVSAVPASSSAMALASGNGNRARSAASWTRTSLRLSGVFGSRSTM